MAALGGKVSEGDRQVRLADAGGTEEDDILGALDESQAGEFVDLRPWRAGGETEVEAVERLDCWEAGDPGEPLEGSGTARGTLRPPPLFHEVGVG